MDILGVMMEFNEGLSENTVVDNMVFKKQIFVLAPMQL